MARSETAAKPGDKVACCARVFDPIITHIDASYCHSQRPVAALSREGEESLFSVSGAKTAKTTEILRKLRMTIDLCVTIKVFDCAPALDRRSSERPSASHPQPSAFTLIELLVVVAIIATLAAILLPALKGGRDRAYTAVCANQLRQINFGLVMYQDDFDRCYPPLLYDGTTTRTDPAMSFMKSLPAAGGNGYVCWLWLLYPYHHKPEIYICPSAKYKGNGWTYDMALGFGSWVSTTGAWSAYCFSATGPPIGPVRQGNEAYTDRKILIFDGREGILGKSPVVRPVARGT